MAHTGRANENTKIKQKSGGSVLRLSLMKEYPENSHTLWSCVRKLSHQTQSFTVPSHTSVTLQMCNWSPLRHLNSWSDGQCGPQKICNHYQHNNKQTNKADFQLWEFCIYITNFIHLQKLLGVQKDLFFFEKYKSLSQDWMTQAGCDSCQHHTPLAAQEPRLLPSPWLPKNSLLPAFPLHKPSGGRGTLQSTQGTHWKFTGQPTGFKCKLSSGHWNPSLP